MDLYRIGDVSCDATLPPLAAPILLEVTHNGSELGEGLKSKLPMSRGELFQIVLRWGERVPYGPVMHVAVAISVGHLFEICAGGTGPELLSSCSPTCSKAPVTDSRITLFFVTNLLAEIALVADLADLVKLCFQPINVLLFVFQ
jgi:hypothetical protein